MSEQPKALRLSEALQQQAVWEGHYGPSYLRDLLPQAAAELRRLHAENQELRDRLARQKPMLWANKDNPHLITYGRPLAEEQWDAMGPLV